MSVTRIASRYAKSLVDLATEKGQLEEVMGDVKSFLKATENRDLYLMIKSPIINATKKQQVFDALFKGKQTDLMDSFLQIVLRKGREAYLPNIAQEFMEQYKKIKHISTVKLTTAAALSAETISKIKQKLTNSEATDDHVELETAVDADILGGFILQFGDKLYDASVARKLKRLRKEFTS